MTLSLGSLASDVLARLEESPSSPLFWATDEVYEFLVEAAREATLMTWEPQVALTGFTLPANQTIVNLPADVIAVESMIYQNSTVFKTTLWELYAASPDWTTWLGSTPQYWFPFGYGQIGIVPQLTAPVSVTLTYVQLPVAHSRPFQSTDTIDLQDEYGEALTALAAFLCTFKEAGPEFVNAAVQHDLFAERMQELGRFAIKKSLLRFSKTLGHVLRVSEQEKR